MSAGLKQPIWIALAVALVSVATSCRYARPFYDRELVVYDTKTGELVERPSDASVASQERVTPAPVEASGAARDAGASAPLRIPAAPPWVPTDDIVVERADPERVQRLMMRIQKLEIAAGLFRRSVEQGLVEGAEIKERLRMVERELYWRRRAVGEVYLEVKPARVRAVLDQFGPAPPIEDMKRSVLWAQSAAMVVGYLSDAVVQGFDDESGSAAARIVEIEEQLASVREAYRAVYNQALVSRLRDTLGLSVATPPTRDGDGN